MNIETVIDESIIAIFSERKLSNRMFLKGGSAIRLFDHDHTRLSIDADFSIAGTIRAENSFFNRIEQALARHFGQMDYSVLDFKFTPRPKVQKQAFPKWWRGWLCQFKLVSSEYSTLSVQTQRRHALIPEGSNSPVIDIEISEHEYCGAAREITLKGVELQGYSKELIVIEKLRALCQQHPDYPFNSSKNRARDFYDIFRLCRDIDDDFVRRCQEHFAPVFAAKEVSVGLLKALWDSEFLSVQERGFAQVVDSTHGELLPFETYVEHARYVVLQILPELQAETTGSRHPTTPQRHE